VHAIRARDGDVGITLKPGTPVEAILPVIELVDLVLVMSVEPGFGGQSFMPDQLEKCRRIKPLLKGHQKLEIDGGINAKTIGEARAAGVDWFVVGSALFDAESRHDAVAEMVAAIRSASAV
jgi:ribulose-phosphate 3-epimerase